MKARDFLKLLETTLDNDRQAEALAKRQLQECQLRYDLAHAKSEATRDLIDQVKTTKTTKKPQAPRA